MEYYPNGALKEEYVLKNKEDRIYQCKKFTPDGKLSEQGGSLFGEYAAGIIPQKGELGYLRQKRKEKG